MVAGEVAVFTDKALDKQSASASLLSTVNLWTIQISTWHGSVMTSDMVKLLNIH